MKKHISYHCNGYKEYLDVSKQLLHVFNPILPDPDARFILAVNEAALNAAKYSVYGVLSAQIYIDVHIDTHEVRVRIESQTQPFDAVQYKERLKKLAEDPNTMDLDWGDYTGVSDKSRGFWYMLSAVDYLIVEATGQHVTLVRRLPFHRSDDSTIIRKIVPRFNVESANGVIL